MKRIAILLLLSACGHSDTQNPPAADGPAEAAVGTDGTIAADDPAGNGPFTVTESTASIPGASTGRTLPATVYATSAPGPHALVVVSPGFQMSRMQYASYAKHLATWGFVAVLTDYADTGFFADHAKLAADVPAVVDWAIAQQPLAIDTARIATAGHSLGGRISVFAATLDPRIHAVVGWDPVDANSPSIVPEKMGGVTAAIAVVGETTNAAGGGMPCAPAAENFQQFYAASPSPAMQITVNGADHMDWVDDPSCGFCGFCTAGTASPDLSRTVTRRLNVAWLRRRLFDDAAMDAWLTTPPELASGSIAIAHR